MSLSAFLAKNAKKAENQKVLISDRFIGEDGKPEAFEIRALTEAENNAIKAECMETITNKGRQITRFDGIKYTNKLVTASVVYPDLMDAELQKSYGVTGEANLLSAMLFAGEFSELSLQVQTLSKFSAEDFEESKDEVKNA